MAYRDEREALRQRAETLEQELGEARRELAELRAAGGRRSEPRAPVPAATSGARASGPPGAFMLLLAALIAAGMALAMLELVAAVPVVMAVLCVVVLAPLLARLVLIAPPHQALVLAGRPGGLRIVRGGRALRLPLVEMARSLDLRPFVVRAEVRNAFAAGAVPVDVAAEAIVKIASDPELVVNAAERFLGFPQAQIGLAAQQVLEGAMREVLSQLTPEQICQDRGKVADAVLGAAELRKLGLEVLGLWIVRVENEYIDGLGRLRIAHALRDAENAENAENARRARGGASQ
ncbi:MAG: flotillin family protein [Deltaproteobacteria bacterium]|nr:flotillin family protein [Deltaproteobacteria bacterium]